MKKLKPLQEKQITLTSGQLDLRTPSGRASEGTFRLLVNVIGDSRGRLKRMGGWRRLTLTPASESTTFAIVGDYGFADANQRAVASMVTGWSPEYIVTTGDNIYGLNSGMTLQQANARFDAVIDAGYRDYYDDGLLYPVIGNHDTDYDPGNPTWFRGKFSGLFGSKNYYRIRKGQAEFFMLSSGYLTGGAAFEPDGNTVGSAQYLWLQGALADSTATFKVVVLHHPPYTSDQNYSPGETDLRWNFEAMGADLVLSGHAHNYERRKDQGVPYVISGNGGATLRGYTGVDPDDSAVDDPPRFGALRCVVNERSLRIESVVVGGTVIDEFELCKGTNEDLHDQLQTNYDGGTVVVTPPTIPVTPPDADGGVEAVVPAELPEIEVTWGEEPCLYDLGVDMSPDPSDVDINDVTWSAESDQQPDLGITSITFEGNWSASCMRISYMPSVQHLSAPYATDLGEPSILENPDLLTVSAALAERINGGQIYIQRNPLLQSISFPSLQGIPENYNNRLIIFTDNPSLTDIDLGSFVPTNWTFLRNGQSADFRNNALSAETVNHILARFAANPNWGATWSGSGDPTLFHVLRLDGGTNAAPTGQGIVDKAALIARGRCTVTTN